MREAHITVAVRLKPRMTILLKRKRTSRSRVACFLAQPPSRPRGALLAKATEGDYPLNTTRLNDFCLCAISQLGSCMSCRSLNYGDSAFNLRFDANAWSGIAVAVHLIRRCYKGATSGLSPQCIKLS
jgi:hypothetical protein